MLRRKLLRFLSLTLLILVVPACAQEAALPPLPDPDIVETSVEAPTRLEPLTFSDVGLQTQEFIGYNETIKLSRKQEQIRREALTAIDAPCCDNNSAYTCCCPCTMAKTAWGLSKFLIAEKDASAAEVRTSVQQWFDFINPNGFTGDVCYSPGGCSRPFHENGCGGM